MKESHHLKNVEDINTEDIVDKDEVKFLKEQLKLVKEKNAVSYTHLTLPTKA